MREVTRLYQQELEPYTSRNRSDSMRTRTSSEASQMYAAVRNVRQRAEGGHFGPLPGYKPPPLSTSTEGPPIQTLQPSTLTASPAIDLMGSDLLVRLHLFALVYIKATAV